MRRIAIVGMILVSLVAVPLAAAAGGSEKSEVCHIQDDGEMKTLTVGGKALEAHMRHGDEPVACEALEEEPPADDSPPANQPPVAYFEANPVCDDFFGICTHIAADSTGSYDPEGGSLVYYWTVTDSTGHSQTYGSAGVVFQIVAGMTSYTVSLVVYDDEGLASEPFTVVVPVP